MGRGDLSDAQWKLIDPLLPKQSRGGKWNDHRLMFNGILWILRTGAPWRDLPERYGKWGGVYHRFNRWRRDGTFDRVLKALRIRLDKNGYIDWDLWCVDGSSVRASRSAAGASKKAKNQGDDPGTMRWVAQEAGGDQSSTWSLTVREFPWPRPSPPGRRTESKEFERLMKLVRPPRWIAWPLKVAGDKGYSYPRVRAFLQRRGIQDVIPQRSDQVRHEGKRKLDRQAYKRRARVEQSVGWLKENRRVGTRYDKLASSFMAFVNLAIMRRYLRILAPDDPSDRT